MESIIAINLYRLSLLLTLVISIFSLEIYKIISPNYIMLDPEFRGIAAFITVVLPTLAIVIILRCAVLYMKVSVKWWDLLSVIVTTLLEAMAAPPLVHSVATIVSVVIIIILLIHPKELSTPLETNPPSFLI